MTNTGGTETKGMDWGETAGKQHMKLFGIKDAWGNIWEWIDGVATDVSRNILTGTNGFNDVGTGYANHGVGANADINGWLSKPKEQPRLDSLQKKSTDR